MSDTTIQNTVDAKEPRRRAYVREVTIGEPKRNNLPYFAQHAFAESGGAGDKCIADRLDSDVGGRAARWLRAEAEREWTYVCRIHRPEWRGEVVEQRLLLFRSATDAECFVWANWQTLNLIKLSDITRRLDDRIAFLLSDVRQRLYDPSSTRWPRAYRQQQFLKRQLQELNTMRRNAASLRCSASQPHSKIARAWLVEAAKFELPPSAIPQLDEQELVVAIDAFERERAAGQYDLSDADPDHWIASILTYLANIRIIRSALRRANTIRRREGRAELANPFQPYPPEQLSAGAS